jgi:hypothetical protein
MVDAAKASGDLVVLRYALGDATAYVATNTTIFERGAWLAAPWHHPVGAPVIWQGAALGADDITTAFLREEQHRGFPVWQVVTL